MTYSRVVRKQATVSITVRYRPDETGGRKGRLKACLFINIFRCVGAMIAVRRVVRGMAVYAGIIH